MATSIGFHVYHLTAIPTVITLLIMLGFQQKLASFVFPKNSQKGILDQTKREKNNNTCITTTKSKMILQLLEDQES